MSDVVTVFEAWRTSVARDVKLTPQRRALIARRLREWSVEDLVDAVRGWEASPFHRGENQDGQVWNDLALLIRDAAHIEKFRDLHRGALNGRHVSRTEKNYRNAVAEFLEEDGGYVVDSNNNKVTTMHHPKRHA